MWTFPALGLIAWLIYWVSCRIFQVSMTIPEGWPDFPMGQPAPPYWNKEISAAIGHLWVVPLESLT
ncbi:hypothetical protein JCGZ_04905 [Jatropha curcas]|uniref:Uncharacterized protein n=1 Tax=Jatropha curcas TaxID=180498 RepID=A0A067KUC5_JATCU|nr:hypothetical protein JCGZ_04905 [Jatropha curcas]